jgi:hypothetical protein
MNQGGNRWLAGVRLLAVCAAIAATTAITAITVFSPTAGAAGLKSDFELGGQWKVNSTARLMAGLAPMYPGHYSHAQGDAWKEHSAAMQGGWAHLRSGRVNAMSSWRNQEISARCPVGKTLLYPFSGPDFFNAYWLFPECDTFVMFGLEHIGEIPDLEAMSERDFARLMSDVRTATADLFSRNYFITENMSRQLYTAQLRGVMPLIMISMALSGAEILRMTPQELDKGSVAGMHAVSGPPAAAGVIPASVPDEPAPKMLSLRKPRGVAIDFRVPGSPEVKRLIYFTVDATDSSLARYPEFLSFLRKFAPTTTLLKSASYLLHTREFSQLRKTLLDVSEFLVQDDSGLPYRMLVSRGFQMRLHGTYAVPIPPFEGAFQPTLQAAYQSQQPGPLPFTFGYNFQDQRDQRANVMVGKKTALPPSLVKLAANERGARPKYAASRHAARRVR